MTNKLIITLIAISLHIAAFSQSIIYVSPTGDAAVSGSTIASPTTIAHAITLATTAGVTIYLRGGIYALSTPLSIPTSKNGAAGNLKKLHAYPGDARPILDFSAMALSSSNRGLSVSASYWHIKGIDIYKAGDNGMNVSGSNNIIEFCAFYENSDTGLQLGGGAANNQIINCDSYYNVDPSQGNADGFAVKLDVGTGNAFSGCRAWQNSDDGWDGYMRPSDDVSTTITNCWAFKNGYLKDGSIATNGNGNGFKMGGSDLKDLRHNMTVSNCLAFQNKVRGFDQNNNKGSMILYNCTSWNNGQNYGMNSSGVTLATGKVMLLKNCISLTTSTANAFNTAAQFATNTWTSGFSVSASDFQSIDPTTAYGIRQADGSLPNVTFMHLTQASTLRNRGTDVGLAFNGTAPDLGCFETTEAVPVNLIRFTATAKNNTTILNWTTASEQNNAGWTVEKSLNPSLNAWETLIFIKGNGTTSTPQYYTASDDNSAAGITYYRLKQADTDGKYTYSKTVSINLNAAEKPRISPNPSRGEATHLQYVGINTGQLDIRIYDATGRLVHTEQAAYQAGQNELLLHVSALSAGRYSVQMVETRHALSVTTLVIVP
jgi:hypothetical protein